MFFVCVDCTARASRKFSIVLTTHSPYILSKFNNLIIAGQIGKRPKMRSSVEKVVNPQFWVKGKIVRAYSLERGKTYDIISESGLIDGEYL